MQLCDLAVSFNSLTLVLYRAGVTWDQFEKSATIIVQDWLAESGSIVLDKMADHVSIFVYHMSVYLCINQLPDDQLPTFQGDLIT